jgi:hypothetical protein
VQRVVQLTAILATMVTGSAISQAASTTGAFSVGITIGHPKAKPYRGAVSYFVPIVPDPEQRYTCAAAEIGLWRKGFRNIRRYDCRGSIYWYGARRSGRTVLVKVSSHSAKILGVRY